MFTLIKKNKKPLKLTEKTNVSEDDSKIQLVKNGSCDPLLPCQLCLGATCLGSLYGCWNCIQECCCPDDDCCEQDC